MSDETRVFEEKPFTIATVTTVISLVVWVALAVLISILGPPSANSKFARLGLKSSAGVAAFVLVMMSIVLGLVWLHQRPDPSA